jgi:hypothetical protein
MNMNSQTQTRNSPSPKPRQVFIALRFECLSAWWSLPGHQPTVAAAAAYWDMVIRIEQQQPKPQNN